MTASLFVSGTPTSPARRDLRDDAEPGTATVVHAVAKPAVDGLESSVCGVLVTATADRDWPFAADGARCEECARIAG
jgi:hypothetical protein